MAKTIMVLFGGASPEYRVSLLSAYHVKKALATTAHRVIMVGINQQGDWYRYTGDGSELLDDTWQDKKEEIALAGPLRSPRDFITALCGCVPDCIFPAVHGVNCEDGALQGMLTLTGIPFVGSKVLASAVCMDKEHARRVFKEAGLPQCRYTTATRREIIGALDEVVERVSQEIKFPCFLKPSNGGSSVGTRYVRDSTDLAAALTFVAEYDPVVLIEEYIEGREIEVSILGHDRLLVGAIGEIITDRAKFKFYDYTAKYLSDDGALVVIPARLSAEMKQKITAYAQKAYRSAGCSGLGRVDFFVGKDGSIYLNEINTIPGFTAISVYPKAFAQIGVSLSELTLRLCEMAIETDQFEQKRQTDERG